MSRDHYGIVRTMRLSSRDTVDPFETKDGSTIRELMHAAHQSLAEATLVPGQATQRHYHAASEELYSVLEGGGLLEVDGEERQVGPGDTVLIPPGARHRLTAGPSGARFLCCCAPPYAHDDTYFD
jgi:mannose-6-phosphate isomerase-like protein (cupin superfamily)